MTTRRAESSTVLLTGISAIALAAAVIAAWGLTSCRSEKQPSSGPRIVARKETDREPIGRPGDSPVNRVAAANVRFGLGLLREIVQRDDKANVVISPSSISAALAMLRLGARGETRTRMGETLGDPTIEPDECGRGHEALRSSRAGFDSEVSLFSANSLWAQKGFQFSPGFLAANRAYFEARVQVVDLVAPETPALINQWAREETRGRIATAVDEKLDPDSILVLLSAVSFKGKWSHKFDRTKTRDGTFVTGAGQRRPVALMEQSGRYRHLKDEHFEAVSLPYGKGRMSLYLFLPEPDRNLSEFCQSLQATNWNAWLSNFSAMDGVVTLPQVRLQYGADLHKPLSALGMEIAFDPGHADFAPLLDVSPQRPFLKKVEHKAFLEIDEEGTEAAATTSATVGLEGMRKFFRLVFDRPFVLAIRDNENGDLLFLGYVANPH